MSPVYIYIRQYVKNVPSHRLPCGHFLPTLPLPRGIIQSIDMLPPLIHKAFFHLGSHFHWDAWHVLTAVPHLFLVKVLERCQVWQSTQNPCDFL